LIAPAPSIRSERLLMERLEYNLLFRWFVGIGVEDVPLVPFGVLEKPWMT
jgi:transposase